MSIAPGAGKPADPSTFTNLPHLVTAYFTQHPDPEVAGQRVSFGTSGHRGSALRASFNEDHILATTQAICQYRREQGVDGPLFLGMDTHALSEPAWASALEVLAANGVEVMISAQSAYTPTPAISHAILTCNRGRQSGLADGIVITPSHNPPEDGGFKYNPPHGGPADASATQWIGARANQFLRDKLQGVARIPLQRALNSASTHRYDYVQQYVDDLASVLDFDVIRSAGIRLGVDPLGGAGVDYWPRIGERYGLALTIVNPHVDATFRFMTLDWDGRIRMDPSSPYAMQSLIGLKDRFDIAFACDTDHDRHGIVTRSVGLVPSNHYLSVCTDYLLAHRPQWRADIAIGKTVVSSSMIDRVTARRGRKLYEVPVGFKYFVDGLLQGALGFVGEESAGSSFLRRDGSVWSTDKDGLIAALLAAEMTARLGRDPGELYAELTRELGNPVYERMDVAATSAQKAILARLSPENVKAKEMAGDPIEQVLTTAPGDGASIGGLKVVTAGGWFAARPSGTEDIYKVYAESFRSEDHLRQIQQAAQELVAQALNA